MNYDDLLQTSIRELLAEHPYIEDFLTSFGLQVAPDERPLQAYLDGLDPDLLPVGGDVHAAQGVSGEDVEAGRNQDELRAVLIADR